MIKEVNEQTKLAFERLLQCYEAEFSAITKKAPDNQGLFKLDTEIGPDVKAFLYYVNENIAGFCMMYLTEKENEICEFYIIPSFRNSDHGSNFAHIIFDEFKNQWVVKQIEGADKARKFWRKAIGTYTNENYEEDQFHDSYWGNVTRQIFKSR